MTGKYDIIYGLESWEDYSSDPDVKGLWQEQYKARYGSQRDLIMSINTNQYAHMSKSLNLLIIVARRNHKMLGYCLLVLAKSMHYNSLDIYENTYWVANSERGNGIGRGLIEFAIKVGKEFGARRIFVSDKRSQVAHELLKSLEFKSCETIYELGLAENKL